MPRLASVIFFTFLLSLVGWQILFAAPEAPPPQNPDMGYGFNVASWDVDQLEELGFNWMKVFDTPTSRQPLNVMLRYDVTASSTVTQVRNELEAIALYNGQNIEAYEIGNEVNLDASYGWDGPPDAPAYTELLCTAYAAIKQYDPTAVVISAGLAVVGRVSGSYEGHPGHNGTIQDDRAFLQEMLDAGGGACLDGVGYHNYGFSAAYDTPPDVNGGTPESNCTNGFCFRSAEIIYDIMVTNGLGDKKVWTTEFGWIIDPREEALDQCYTELVSQGRGWQLVSLEEQADNLVGSFQYAADNWPWMGGIMVFNLNFNQAGYYTECEQMRFYSVEERPAAAALRAMPKAYAYVTPTLNVDGPAFVDVIISTDVQTRTLTTTLTLENMGDDPLTYSVRALTGSTFLPNGALPFTGTIGAQISETLPLTFTLDQRPLGTYTATLLVESVAPVEAVAYTLPVRVRVVETVTEVFLPMLHRDN